MIQLETTLKQLNDLFEALGTWQEVADTLCYNRATVNKWFSGKRIPTQETRDYIAYMHVRVDGRRA